MLVSLKTEAMLPQLQLLPFVDAPGGKFCFCFLAGLRDKHAQLRILWEMSYSIVKGLPGLALISTWI